MSMKAVPFLLFFFSRDQTILTASANSVRSIPANPPDDSGATSPAIVIKQEPNDETVKEDSVEGRVTSRPSSALYQPRNDTLPNTDQEPVSVDTEKVKQEKDTAVIECSKCNIRFQDKGQLQEHACTVVSQWSCEHCSKYFKSKDTLYKHKKYFCPKKKNSCVCKGCSKMFTSVIEMAQHQKVHLRVCISLQEESLYTCTVCGKKFAARSMLEMHKKSHSSGNFCTNQTEKFSVQPKVSPGKVLIKQFKCQHCPKSYTRKEKLKYHMKTHLAEEQISSVPEWSMEIKQANNNDKDNNAISLQLKKCTCKYCGHVCDDSAALWLHMLQQHSSEKSYRCDKCGKNFSHLHAYSNHKKTHSVKICCRVCGKQYSSGKALREHEYNKHTIQKAMHQCRLCTESFATRSAFLIHSREHHTKGKSSASLLEGSQVKVGTFPCSVCSERFPSTVALMAHMQMHIGTDVRRKDMGNGNQDQGPASQSSYKKEREHCPSLTCKICFRLFSNKSGLQRHIKIHATGKHVFYPCKICGKKFVSESTYKTHAATHLVSSSFHCPQCNKIFFKEEIFKNHMCENTGSQACLKSGVLLTEEQHLNHVCGGSNLKSSESLVKCSICFAVFNSIKARNNHMRIHGKQSMPITALPSHLKNFCSRMSNGLYRCNLCGKVTVTQQGAAGHARWHYNPQPVKAYKCPFCNRRYTTETALYTHIAVEHPDVPG
jgi:KRAB domain-containing zinc finger protein